MAGSSPAMTRLRTTRAAPMRVFPAMAAWARFALPTLRPPRVRHELGPDFRGVFAEGGDGAVMTRCPVVARGRGGVGDGARGRADLDAAELRGNGGNGAVVDAGQGDAGARKPFRQHGFGGGAEHGRDARV